MTMLQGRTALITGAGSGIGRATAIRFAHEGALVAVTDWDEASAAEVAATIVGAGGRAAAIRLDVRDESDWADAFETTAAELGDVDILIANAGVSFARPIADMTLDEWHAVFAVNLDGVFLGVRQAIRAMRSRGAGGAIVIVSSASGLKASPGASAYCASKAAATMFARAAALECAGDGIRVNAIHPAGVVTPMWREMPFFADLVKQHGGEEGAWQALAAQTPIGRFAQPEEIAAGILYLCSDAAACMTGSALVLDGGFTA
jgi:3(or 17)beta-hydroxysteroid dehydrogenase